MPTREQRAIETFVYLADTLVDRLDIDEMLHTLCERCVELLEVDAAGVMLAMRPGELHAVASWGQDMRLLEVFEVQVSEGPSFAAYTSGEPVSVTDLSTEVSRWPNFVPRALEMGLVAGHGFPLRLRERTIGALNVFQLEGRAPLSETELMMGRGFADVAAIGLIQNELLEDAQTTIEQLGRALTSRVVIEQAKGILVERRGVAPQEAFEELRKHARDRGLRVREVADTVVGKGVDAL